MDISGVFLWVGLTAAQANVANRSRKISVTFFMESSLLVVGIDRAFSN
jgi:hypothetical protein